MFLSKDKKCPSCQNDTLEENNKALVCGKCGNMFIRSTSYLSALTYLIRGIKECGNLVDGRVPPHLTIAVRSHARRLSSNVEAIDNQSKRH